jgi:hypothetical protein
MKSKVIQLVAVVIGSVAIVVGCGGESAPPVADSKTVEQQKTLRKLDSPNEKEQLEGAREAAKQFGEPKKGEQK